MPPRSRLVIKDSRFMRAWVTLLERTKADPKVARTFAKDPAGTINTLLFDEANRASKYQVSKANRLLFSIISNTEFMAWASNYQAEIVSKLGHPTELTPEQLTPILNDVTRAMVEHADRELLTSLFHIDPDRVRLIVKEKPTDWIDWGQDVALVFETVAVVAVAVVVVIAIADVFVAKEAHPGVLTRMDLARISRSLEARLEKEAISVREKGGLAQM